MPDKPVHEMFAIQWYDPFMPQPLQPYKDGPPRGRFQTEDEAREAAENAAAVGGGDIPYDIVKISGATIRTVDASYQDKLEEEYLNQIAASSKIATKPWMIFRDADGRWYWELQYPVKPGKSTPSGFANSPEEAETDAKEAFRLSGYQLKTAAPEELEEEEDEPAETWEVPDPEAEPPAPEPEYQVERTESATEAVSPPTPKSKPVPVSQPEEADLEVNVTLPIRAKAEAELSDPDTVEAVMEFLREEKLEDAAELGIKEGVWNWSEGSNFATVSLGNSEWVVAPSEKQAERLALAMVKQQLEDEPELFTPSWLEGYIDENKLRDHLSLDIESEVRDNPESYGWEPPEDEEDDKGQIKMDFDPGPTDEWVENAVKEILRDPMQYLEDIYDDEAREEAIRMVGFDEDQAAQDAVDADGIGFFLSPEERDIHNLPGGGCYWRA